MSGQIREIFSRYTDLIEPLALDEAYLDVTANLHQIATAGVTAARIRADILSETALTASAGVSYNKFLAKLASDQRKPNGQFTITPEAGPAFVEALRIEKFYGIGPVTAERMQQLGISSGADLKAQSLDFLVEHFGKFGRWYHAIARGEDDRPVEPNRRRKSSSSENTFLEDTVAPDLLETEVERRAREVWSWCEKTGIYGRTVTVKIKYSDFQQVTRSKTHAVQILDRNTFFRISLDLIRSVIPVPQGVRLIGVGVSNFEEVHPAQLSFDDLLA